MSTEQKNTAPQITNWDIQSKNLKARFPQLNETDLKLETGKEDELINRLQNKLNTKREDVMTFIKESSSDKTNESEKH